METVVGIAIFGSAETRRARDPSVVDALRMASAERWRVSESMRIGSEDEPAEDEDGVPSRARSWVANMSRLGLRSLRERCVGGDRTTVSLPTMSVFGFRIATPPHCGRSHALLPPMDSGITKGLTSWLGM